MTDDPLDRESDQHEAEPQESDQHVAEALREAPLPPMPDLVRDRLETVLRDAQARRANTSGHHRSPRTIGA